MRRASALLVAVALALSVWTVGVSRAQEPSPPGTPAKAAPATAPEAPVTVKTGETVESMDYDGLMRYIIAAKGKVVVVTFWATWCGPCLKELPGLMRLRDMLPRETVAFVAVSLDYDPAAMRAFLARRPLNFPAFLAGQDLMDLLRIQAIPRTMLYDANGLQVQNKEGYLPAEELEPLIQGLLAEKGPRP